MESASNKNHVYPINYELTQYSNGVSIEEWEFETKEFLLKIRKTDHLNDSKSNRFIAEFDDFQLVTKTFLSLLSSAHGFREEVFYCVMSSGGDIKEEEKDCFDLPMRSNESLIGQANYYLNKKR